MRSKRNNEKESKRVRSYGNNHYIAKGFSVILIAALIFLISYGSYRDRAINKRATEILAAQRLEKNNAEILATKVIDKKILDKKILDNETNKYKNKNWMAIGGSITFRNEYQKYVKQTCGFANVTTLAEPGIPLYLMDNKVTIELLKNIDVVTVFAGAADFGGNRPLGAINDTTLVDTFYSDMKAVIENIEKIKPQVKLVFITTPYIGKDGFGFLTNPIGNTLEDYTKAMKEVCLLYDIAILDLNINSGININNLTTYSDDSVQPNAVGMELVGNKIGQFLNTLK